MELFRKLPVAEFEKTASKFLLGDNPRTYPTELIAQLYKQHPYLGQYAVNISIEGKDESLGYLYGVFTTSPASFVPPVPDEQRMGEVISGPEAPPDPQQTLRIPIIVEAKKGFSFDVFIGTDGKFLPLSQERVASALFNASPYVAAPTPGPQANDIASANMDLNNIPGGGIAGGNGFNGSYGEPKMASILDEVLPTVSPEVLADYLEKHFLDPLDNTKLARWHRPAIRAAFDKMGRAYVAKSELGQVEKTAQANQVKDASWLEARMPIVISRSTKEAGAFEVLGQGLGNYPCFLKRAEAAAIIPVEIRERALSGEQVILTKSSSALELYPEYTDGLVDVGHPGVYAVMTKTGSSERAVVLTDLMDLTGRRSDLSLVMSPSASSLQEKVAGVKCGEIDVSVLKGSVPQGDGVFIMKSANAATLPVYVKMAVMENGEPSYYFNSGLHDGVIKLSSVLRPIDAGDGLFLLPNDSVFVPVRVSGEQFMSTHEDITKTATAGNRDDLATIEKRPGDDTYTMTMSKVGAKITGRYEDMLFMLAVMNDTDAGAKEKLAKVMEGETVRFLDPRPVKELESTPYHGDLIEEIRVDLAKEAAVLGDKDTVDSVLSLNFITPDNMATYVDSIPVLEEAVSGLAELLIGVRLGLSDVPESAVLGAMNGTEKSLQGLKRLQIRLGTPV